MLPAGITTPDRHHKVRFVCQFGNAPRLAYGRFGGKAAIDEFLNGDITKKPYPANAQQP